MSSIYINFSDFYTDFDICDNPFFVALSKKHDVHISTTPDFLFYSCFGTDFRRYKNCVKIFYTGENLAPNFNECDYALGFSHLSFEDRYLRYNMLSASLPEGIMERSTLENSLAERKFCNFVYSNESVGEGSILRKQFCQKLMAYKHVDCLGKVLNNMTDGITPRMNDWVNGKLEVIRQYKFTIAFENSSTSGYTTEKMHHPLIANSVPIYWGDPKACHDVNPNAFINCHAFGSFDDVIQRIIEVDKDNSQYMSMIRQPAMQHDYNFDKTTELETFLENIITKGNTPFCKNPANLPHKPKRSNLINRLKREVVGLLRP